MKFVEPVPHEIAQHLPAGSDPRKRILAIAAEWARGCTCSDDDKPWTCDECTKAMIEAILNAARAANQGGAVNQQTPTDDRKLTPAMADGKWIDRNTQTLLSTIDHLLRTVGDHRAQIADQRETIESFTGEINDALQASGIHGATSIIAVVQHLRREGESAAEQIEAERASSRPNANKGELPSVRKVAKALTAEGMKCSVGHAAKLIKEFKAGEATITVYVVKRGEDEFFTDDLTKIPDTVDRRDIEEREMKERDYRAIPATAESMRFFNMEGASDAGA